MFFNFIFVLEGGWGNPPSHYQIIILQEAKPFPRVSASTLSGTKVEFPQQLCGHVSLVTVSLRAIGMVCDWIGLDLSFIFFLVVSKQNINELYRQPFVKAFGGHPMISVWEVRWGVLSRIWYNNK